MQYKMSRAEWERVGMKAGWLKESKAGQCWSGYKMVGMKRKGKRRVPNCVPK
jgi:hypothetical protein